MDQVGGVGLAVVGLQQRVEERGLAGIGHAHQVDVTFVLPGLLQAGHQRLHAVARLGADEVDVGQEVSKAGVLAAPGQAAPDPLQVVGRVGWKQVHLVPQDEDAFVGPHQLRQVGDDGVRDVQHVHDQQHQSSEGPDVLDHGPVLLGRELEAQGLLVVGEQVAALAGGPAQTSLLQEDLELLTGQVPRQRQRGAVQNSAAAWTAGVTEGLVYVRRAEQGVLTLPSRFLLLLLLFCGSAGVLQREVKVVELDEAVWGVLLLGGASQDLQLSLQRPQA